MLYRVTKSNSRCAVDCSTNQHNPPLFGEHACTLVGAAMATYPVFVSNFTVCSDGWQNPDVNNTAPTDGKYCCAKGCKTCGGPNCGCWGAAAGAADPDGCCGSNIINGDTTCNATRHSINRGLIFAGAPCRVPDAATRDPNGKWTEAYTHTWRAQSITSNWCIVSIFGGSIITL